MLIAKGYAVSFILVRRDGSSYAVSAPRGYGLLHDPSGKDWPACSGLVAPFSKSREKIEDGPAADYFEAAPLGGKAKLPPRALSNWKRVGKVDEIEYARRRPGSLPASHKADYYHPFKGSAVLYRLGRVYRIELEKGCVWNWRGIVCP